MDETERAVINAAAKAMLGPIAQPVGDLVANAIGALGGDFITDYRKSRKMRRQQAATKVIEETQIILNKRGVTPDPETPPEHLEEIIEAAQDNSIPELRDLFARLAAAAVDPKRQRGFRKEFIGIIKEMEPVDTLTLPNLMQDATGQRRNDMIRRVADLSNDEIAVSLRNLRRLEVVDWHNINPDDPFLTPLGRHFLKVISD